MEGPNNHKKTSQSNTNKNNKKKNSNNYHNRHNNNNIVLFRSCFDGAGVDAALRPEGLGVRSRVSKIFRTTRAFGCKIPQSLATSRDPFNFTITILPWQLPMILATF